MTETEAEKMRRIFDKTFREFTNSKEYKEWLVDAIFDETLKDLPEEWKTPEKIERLKEIIREEIKRAEAEQKNM